MSLTTVSDIAAQLELSGAQAAEPLGLRVGPVSVCILCEGPLRDVLADYFKEATDVVADPDITVHVVEGQALDPAPAWQDWAREPGKTGRKDAIHDLTDGRLIHKRRTGVTFLQSTDLLVAFGPVTENANQVVNFVNTQVLNNRQRAGWEICHAAAVSKGGRTLAIAGLSGGGKSTSILRMMDIPGMSFMTNDRLLVQADGLGAQGLGIPKHPRINPGTILGNDRLHDMLSAQRKAELRAMPADDLWQLEEKYDLFISDIYGAGRIEYAAPLTDFWVLNWQRDEEQVTMIEEVDLAARPDLLAAIMKSAGPFYQFPDGSFLRDTAAPDPEGYLAALRNVRVQEVTGRLDFDAIAYLGRELFDA
ncbi:HprK-related kinase B [Tritonibacter scottomollicae]|uniref:HprK-related kinase B n=1 Tax=Tritonibacter scottomollicae TaxID=483013 RepID=A0ABZ0HFP3_TRISK|nr:HprK-related kinase B [Tritonibacter scottomollicae]WOI32944.1 HprK-related kinase B [Tritonibacter scottomollicae]